MIDFLTISAKPTKQGVEIAPKFIIKNPPNDLMIRGGDFYAIWVEEKGLWSTNEQDVITIVDRELDKFAEEQKGKFDGHIKIMHMWDADSGIIDKWHKYCQKQMRDSYHSLDEKIIFDNAETKKKDYASKKLPYSIGKGSIECYDRLMSVLYSPEERKKIEWAIGSIITGESKKIQKFLVLYGSAGTGKSTVLNIIQQLFEGYYSVFDAKSLGSSNNAFALEAFKSNPLVAIQHDGDLSHIEDNTRLNSLVAHELMTVNEKFKSQYSNRFNSFLFMGTNKPVKITDARSGLLRRLIDVSPTGNTVPPKEYRELVKGIGYELGAIAEHCKEVYEDDRGCYDDYIPVNMMGASNDFYNFVIDNYHIFKKEDGTTLAQAWAMYKTYNEQANVLYPFSKRVFKEELKNYFRDFDERFDLGDGTRVRSYYSGFKKEQFETDYAKEKKKEVSKKNDSWLIFEEQKSVFDKEFADCPAQYGNAEDKPTIKWANVKTSLKDIDTSRVHFVQVPKSLVTIDFDFPGEDGNKSLEKNIEEASKWPPTYAELSKSGCAVHLEYYYTGDPDKLSRLYSDFIEVKVQTGNASLRRKLTRCNNLAISTISSGLPFKEEKVVNFDSVKSEKGLRNLIERNLNKEIHPGTKPSVDFIFKILEDAYADGLKYDVTDMRQRILNFAANSTHQSETCLKTVSKMRFKSEEPSDNADGEGPIIFYDVEVLPNLFVICWKAEGKDMPVVRMINPGPSDVEDLMRHKLVGFNCRRYDNHILYARLMGYDNQQLYNLSQKIVSGESRSCFFGEAYNISYTDVYDFCSKKQGLKKWEIELGIHHKELGWPWDKPVPEDMWQTVAEYCDNDVLATEAVWNARKADFIAREVLADVAGMTVNDTTNTLTTRIIFGTNRHPQDQFEYRDMADTDYCGPNHAAEIAEYQEYSLFDSKNRPIFPGYIFEKGKSTYRGEEAGEGGYVYAEPGIYTNVALLDIASMHPSSIIAENLFGDVYTKRFKEIVEARIAIKHKDFNKAKKMLGGSLAKYLEDEGEAKNLANALKIAINSVYGLTSAKFENAFRDPRNADNIVAKRGALFMINLKYEVQKRGFTVAHIKTDSIKIPNATPEIIKFVMDYGKLYGYTFEHEATYDRMCLVNDAVYIAKYDDGHWEPTGKQFAVPYVFKSLFSHDEMIFEDLCDTQAVSKGEIQIDMNEDLPDVTALEKELGKLEDKYKEGKVSDTTFEKESARLEKEIAKGHNYIFVGRVGQFCPIKAGCGGGVLYRKQDDRYYALPGTKGYRWLESEIVKELGKEKDIDESYYISLADKAKEEIGKYGDFEAFVSESPYISPNFINVPEGTPEELPFE